MLPSCDPRWTVTLGKLVNRCIVAERRLGNIGMILDGDHTVCMYRGKY